MGDCVFVSGGRHFEELDVVNAVLDRRHAQRRIDLIVHGDCPTGVDMLADEWARTRKVSRILFPANWDGLGRSAGYQRNELMADLLGPRAHCLIAFPGGPGTAHMRKQAWKKGIPVFDVDAASKLHQILGH